MVLIVVSNYPNKLMREVTALCIHQLLFSRIFWPFRDVSSSIVPSLATMAHTNSTIQGTKLYKLFSEKLHSQFLRHGFETQGTPWIDVTVHRFGIKYQRKTVDMCGNLSISKLDFIGMPMGDVLILCYGMVEGNCQVDAKIKIKSCEEESDILKRFEKDFIVKLIEVLSSGLEDLPLELKINVAKLLTAEDTLRLSQVNKTWNAICSHEDVVWKHHLKRDFPSAFEKMKDINCSWKTKYKEEFLKLRSSWSKRGLRAPDPILALPDIPRFLPIGPPLHPLPDLIPDPDYNIPDPLHPNQPFGGPGNDIFRPNGSRRFPPPGGGGRYFPGAPFF